MKKNIKELSKNRFARLKTLRQTGAPIWVIKSEQIALCLNRQGLKHAGIGRKFSDLQTRLYEKYVVPHMENFGEN